MLVSELVTNAVRFAGDPARTLRYSERANASLISLSLRHFRECLLIEVYDTDDNPPVLSARDDDAESGRGLMLVDALSKEWSYFFPPGGGKVVYCFLEITMTRDHDVSQLTTAELELTMRQLRANLALITPGSPAHAPIQAHIRAIDAELAGRAGTGSPAQASAATARYFPARRPLPSARRAGIPIRKSPRPMRDGQWNEIRAHAATGTRTTPTGDVRRPACPLPPRARALPQTLPGGTAAVPGDAGLPG